MAEKRSRSVDDVLSDIKTTVANDPMQTKQSMSTDRCTLSTGNH